LANKSKSVKKVSKVKATAKKVSKAPVKVVKTKAPAKAIKSSKPAVKKIIKQKASKVKAPAKVTKKITKPSKSKAKTQKTTPKKIKSISERKEAMAAPETLESLPVFTDNGKDQLKKEFDFNDIPDFNELQTKLGDNQPMDAQPTQIPEEQPKKGLFNWFGKKETTPVLEEAPKKEEVMSNQPIIKAEDKKMIFDEEIDLTLPVKAKETAEKPVVASIDVPKDPATLLATETQVVPEKKSIFSKLFGKKEEPKVEIQNNEVKLPEEIKQGFQEDINLDRKVETDTPNVREQKYLEEMYKKMDEEIRERHLHLDSKENNLSVKEKEIKKKEEKALKSEMEASKKDKEYQQIKKLQEELENQKISQKYQKQKIEELKSELALKDAALREKEIELDKKADEIKRSGKFKKEDIVLEKENNRLKTEINEEDDAIEYLEQEIEQQKREFEKKMMSLKMDSVQEDNKVNDIPQLINKCYEELAKNNMQTVNRLYTELRTKYISEGKKQDTTGEIYKEIIKLYEDINASLKK
jgi:hypothetical protein